MKVTKNYSNDEITVRWQPDLCIHSANCVRGLPGVFDSGKKPWINMEGATSEAIKQQVRKCPSRALSIADDFGNKDAIELIKESVVADSKPRLEGLEEGKTYAWCACGRSQNQPWCDGSHKVTSITPVVFRSDTSGTKAMCMCKQTANKPFCDGTHNTL